MSHAAAGGNRTARPSSSARPERRRIRRGITLLEVLVSIALILLITAVVMPMVGSALGLEQHAAAHRIALMYEQLHDEAILRNKTYRVVFDLDKGVLHVESGDPDALIFSDPEAREEWEEDEVDRLEDMSDADRTAYQRRQQFEKVSGEAYGDHIALPPGSVFRSVYTPQYAEPVRRGDGPRDREAGRDGETGRTLAYSYVFANGFAEHTVIQITDEDDDADEGFTITVDPLSGKVVLRAELIDQLDAWDWLPEEGPRLSF